MKMVYNHLLRSEIGDVIKITRLYSKKLIVALNSFASVQKVAIFYFQLPKYRTNNSLNVQTKLSKMEFHQKL